jgi:predicted TIM-barrel fold metal-dependent hydrolase
VCWFYYAGRANKASSSGRIVESLVERHLMGLEHVYLDLSYGIPFLGYNEMLQFTRVAFDVAPSSKLLYSSDGIRVPEIHWLSARDGRRIVGEVLGERVDSGELDVAEAERVGVGVLRDNALRVYGIAGR